MQAASKRMCFLELIVCQELARQDNWPHCKELLFTTRYSGDLRQESSNNSVTNFVLGFSYIFQRETKLSFEDLLLVVLLILRRRFAIRF